MTTSTSTSIRILALAALLGTSLTEAGSGKSGKELPSCPKYTGGSSRDNCDKETIKCGETYHNEKVFLKEDLKCDQNETIVFKGPKALLDCNGYTIQGYYEDDEDSNIVELIDGASVYDCNFLMGYNAIKTSGEGCSTVEKVSSMYARNDGIRITSNGTVILKDISTVGSELAGIRVKGSIYGELYVGIQNFQSTGDHSFGLWLESQDDDTEVEVEMFGTNRIEFPRTRGIFVLSNNELTNYGDISITGSARGDGIFSLSSNVTFADGSSGVICYNDVDIMKSGNPNNNFVVEDGVTLVCDTGNQNSTCTDSCNDFPNKAKVCVT